MAVGTGTGEEIYVGRTDDAREILMVGIVHVPEERSDELFAASQAFYESGRVDAYLKYARLRERKDGGPDPQGHGDPDGGLPGQR